MKWETERWVKLYTRDTISWRALPWEARGIFCLLLRIADLDGEIDMPTAGIDSLAAALSIPTSVMHAAIHELLKSETILIENGKLLIPNFVEAQRAVTSNAERQRRHRERNKTLRDVTPLRYAVTEGVTESVTPVTLSRNGVTNRIEEKRFNPPYPPSEKPSVVVNSHTHSNELGETPIPGPQQPLETTLVPEDYLGHIQETKTLPRAKERPRHVRGDQAPFLKQAYSDGIELATGKRFAVTGGDMKILDDAVDAHAPDTSGKHFEWLKLTVRKFAEDKKEDPEWQKFKGGLSPKGFIAWLNDGRHLSEPESEYSGLPKVEHAKPLISLEEAISRMKQAAESIDG